MIIYNYTAKHTITGETVKAQVRAESPQAAAKLLTAQQLFPISIENEAANRWENLHFGSGVSSKEKVIFTRQLSTLINAGLPLVQALHTVQEQIRNKILVSILESIISEVEGGSTLASAFGAYPNIFNQVYVNLVAAGESSGTLDETLERLANQQEKDAQIVRKIRGALIYPIIVLFVIVAVVIFMLLTVLPQIGQLYHDLGKTLPTLTLVLLTISNFFAHFWWFTIILLGLFGYGVANYMKTEKGKTMADRAKLNLPLIGRMFKKVYMARFARTLGTLLATGVPVLQALGVVKEAVSNGIVGNVITKSIEQVKGGKSLSETLENNNVFLPLVPQMIKIGEQSGSIDAMLNKVAVFYENEVDEEIKNLTTTMEPALTVVMGVVVGLVIAAILLPVYSLVGGGGISNLK